MTDQARQALVGYLESFVTPERLAKMRGVLASRTRWVSVLLEDVFQPHNASAVLRTCDALGVQDIHVVEGRNEYRPHDDVALGTAQWLSLNRYRGPTGLGEASAALKRRGYRLVATTPHTRAQNLEDLDLSRGPIALMFGTELTGLTDAALSLADEFVAIPMHGFVESFNISVCAALCLYSLTTKLRASKIDWHLGADEQATLQLEWLRTSQKRAAALERRWWADHPEFTP